MMREIFAEAFLFQNKLRVLSEVSRKNLINLAFLYGICCTDKINICSINFCSNRHVWMRQHRSDYFPLSLNVSISIMFESKCRCCSPNAQGIKNAAFSFLSSCLRPLVQIFWFRSPSQERITSGNCRCTLIVEDCYLFDWNKTVNNLSCFVVSPSVSRFAHSLSAQHHLSFLWIFHVDVFIPQETHQCWNI